MSQLIFISKKSESKVFNAIGFEVHVIKENHEINDILTNLNNKVVVVGYSSEIKHLINTFKQQKQSFFPLLLEIPLTEVNKDEKIMEIKESIKKSIGIDLL